MSLNQRMDKENVVCLHNGVLLSRKKTKTKKKQKKTNDILKFVFRWMELEKNILSKVTQTKEDSNLFTAVFCKPWISWTVNMSNDFIKSVNLVLILYMWFQDLKFFTNDTFSSLDIIWIAFIYFIWGGLHVYCLPGGMFNLLAY